MALIFSPLVATTMIAVLPWRHPCYRFELVGKIALRAIGKLMAYQGTGIICVFQQEFRFADFFGFNELTQRQSRLSQKEFLQPISGIPAVFRQLVQVDFVMDLRKDVGVTLVDNRIVAAVVLIIGHR